MVYIKEHRRAQIQTIVDACLILYPFIPHRSIEGCSDIIHMTAFLINVDLTISEKDNISQMIYDSNNIATP